MDMGAGQPDVGVVEGQHRSMSRAARAPGPDRLAVRRCLPDCRKRRIPARPNGYLADGNRSAKPWKNGRSASSPQRSSHNVSVLLLSHQPSGWTTPRTGQTRVLASRETRLHGWQTDRIVPTPRVSSPLSAPSPMEVEGGRFFGCSVGIEDKPAGDPAHGLTEQLRRT